MKPTASFDKFTDAKGRTLSWEEGCEEAARVVMRQYETDFVEEIITSYCSPEQVLVWLVDPDTGEFPDA